MAIWRNFSRKNYPVQTINNLLHAQTNVQNHFLGVSPFDLNVLHQESYHIFNHPVVIDLLGCVVQQCWSPNCL